MRLTRPRYLLLAAGVLFCACLGVLAWRQARASQSLIRWFSQPEDRAGLITRMDLQPCPEALFILPSSGFVGLLWGDTRLPYSVIRQHSGLDIFGDGEVGRVPVLAAYDGYLTRLPDWRSAVIIRHPHDPLEPSRQIWTYYAHMADEAGNTFIVEAFPPGSVEVPVERGTLLGYQGLYNGGNGRIGLHLHFSIVRDDGNGQFLNETVIENTIDPSPYLGMRVNHSCAEGVPHCVVNPACP
jgi:murein DD-endopeptidase MepM/ murein hydrolase activator NlpD